jgi:hypothetical protein
VKLSPDLAVFVEIVELVQTEIGVPAASVKTRGGAGGGALTGDDEPVDEFRPEVPGFDELPEGDETEDPPPGFVAAELAAAVEPSAAAGEAEASGEGVTVVTTLFGEVASCEEQAVCIKSVTAANEASRKILVVFDFIKSSFD